MCRAQRPCESMTMLSNTLSEYSPSSETTFQPSPVRFFRAEPVASARRRSGVSSSTAGSYRSSSRPPGASFATRDGSGRSRQGSGASIRTMSMPLRMNPSSSASSSRLVEKVPKRPSTNRATCRLRSRACVTLSTSPSSMPTSSSRLLFSVTRTFPAPRVRAMSMLFRARAISPGVRSPVVFLSMFILLRR